MTTPPDSKVDIFISHSSKDAIARELCQLIAKHVYGGDKETVKARLFFTSDPERGLTAGQHLGKIFEKLEGAKRVVAVITPRSLAAPAVLAEMALAMPQEDKLILAAGRAAYLPLQWPFADLVGRALDVQADVEALLMELAQATGRRLDASEAFKDDCKAFATAARSQCRHPAARARWLAAAAAAALILTVAASFSAGAALKDPRRYTISETPQSIGLSKVQLLFYGTLPRKLLSTRLSEIHQQLTAHAANLPSSVAAGHFGDAIEQTGGQWGFSKPQIADVQKLTSDWDGGDSQLQSWSAAKIPCPKLKKPVDQRWCKMTEALREDTSNLLDHTPFAIVAVGDPKDWRNWQTLTMGGPVSGHPDWRVKGVNTVTIEVLR